MILNANDLKLTTYQRLINSNVDPLNIALRDGHLKKAFLIAMQIESAANSLMQRLNELQYGS